MEHNNKARYYVVLLDGSCCLVSTYHYNEAGNPTRENESGMYKLHWGASPQYMTYDDVKIVENYGVVTEDPTLSTNKDEVNREQFRNIISNRLIDDPNYPVEDLIRLHFCKVYLVDRVKPVSPTCTDGWISPEGKFYACGLGEHISLASALAKIVYESFDEEQCMENHKWLKMYNTGRVAYLSADNVTSSQLNCLIDIQSCTAKGLSLKNLDHELHDIIERQL